MHRDELDQGRVADGRARAIAQCVVVDLDATMRTSRCTTNSRADLAMDFCSGWKAASLSLPSSPKHEPLQVRVVGWLGGWRLGGRRTWLFGLRRGLLVLRPDGLLLLRARFLVT